MLRNTFCHIPGIGLETEKRLWAAGIRSWEDLLANGPAGLPAMKSRAPILWNYVGQSLVHLQDGNAAFFAGLLTADQHWRLLPEFRHSIAYLDIETTGMGNPGDHITTIALYDGNTVFTYVYGENLEDFGRDIERYAVLVTYNGKCFDIPVLRRALGIPLPQVHIDLRYVLRSLGYKGGLKGCEKQLGLDRGELDGVDGLFAVLLWRDYRRSKDRRVLETLLAYNVEDTVNLETLLYLAYNQRIAQTPFAGTLKLELPGPPALPHRADAAVIARVRDALMQEGYPAFSPIGAKAGYRHYSPR